MSCFMYPMKTDELSNNTFTICFVVLFNSVEVAVVERKLTMVLGWLYCLLNV